MRIGGEGGGLCGGFRREREYRPADAVNKRIEVSSASALFGPTGRDPPLSLTSDPLADAADFWVGPPEAAPNASGQSARDKRRQAKRQTPLASASRPTCGIISLYICFILDENG